MYRTPPLNPDFGQVEADPAEVNLSNFETIFDERRPFFLEGTRLLSSRVRTNYFYSRRIGARPDAHASGDFVYAPRESTILGAAKLTGRLSSGLSLAFLGAVTDEETARTFDRGGAMIERVQVAPRTFYGVACLEQEFGPNASTASLMFTAAHRNLGHSHQLAERLARNAFSINSDSVLRFRGGEYELRFHSGMSYVDGDAAAILRVQRSPVRYLQRPDADYITFDPTRTKLVGFKGGTELERTSGRHWLWSATLDIESPELELNDVGRLRSGDGVALTTNLRYRETEPGDHVRAYANRGAHPVGMELRRSETG